MESSIREPAVAGSFYPSKASELDSRLRELVPHQTDRHVMLACVAPHAGYIYSGGVAGQLYGHLDVPRRVVVMGPNHTGIGAPIAVAPHVKWRTPLGDLTVDQELASALVEAHGPATFDANAHWREHSLEVQLPFLVVRRPGIQVVPICLGHLLLDACVALGQALADQIRTFDEPVGIVASSDMTHYQPEDQARRFDQLAIDAALTMDPVALYETVHRESITMCGVIPATVAMAAANALGAAGAHLVAYATSGETSGDTSAVVGYAGICFHK